MKCGFLLLLFGIRFFFKTIPRHETYFPRYSCLQTNLQLSKYGIVSHESTNNDETYMLYGTCKMTKLTTTKNLDYLIVASLTEGDLL